LAEVRDGEIVTARRFFASPPLPHPLYANLGNQVDLLGYSLRLQSPSPGYTIYLTLYWQARGNMDTDYTVFTHLIDEGENILAQHDSQPEGGNYPTSQWLQGEIVEDEHAVIPGTGLQPGEYTLAVGMYDLGSGERLPAYDQNGVLMPQRRIVLTRIQLRD
jgi:hypothetical protein